MPNHYSYRSGRSITNVQAQEIGEVLERLRAQHGKLTPEIVLDEAANPESPLHAAFEWDDVKAAHERRIDMARRVITSIKVINPPTGKPIVAFVSVKAAEVGRTYMPTIEALSDETIRYRVLDELHSFLEALRRRYAGFDEACRIIDGIKKHVG